MMMQLKKDCCRVYSIGRLKSFRQWFRSEYRLESSRLGASRGGERWDENASLLKKAHEDGSFPYGSILGFAAPMWLDLPWPLDESEQRIHIKPSAARLRTWGVVRIAWFPFHFHYYFPLPLFREPIYSYLSTTVPNCRGKSMSSVESVDP